MLKRLQWAFLLVLTLSLQACFYTKNKEYSIGQALDPVFPVGSASIYEVEDGAKLRLIVSLVKDHYEIYTKDDRQSANYKLYKSPDSASEYFVEVTNKHDDKNYFAVIKIEKERVTLYDMQGLQWLFPENLRNMFVPGGDELIESANPLTLLRQVTRLKIELDPQVRRVRYRLVSGPGLLQDEAGREQRPSAIVGAPPDLANAENRLALVIGNSHYRNAPFLPNPVNDAKAVATALQRAGFTVTRREDLDHEQLVKALAQFAGEVGAADWALVYFSGHGLEMSGSNYVVPVDATLATDVSVQFEAVPIGQLMGAVDRAKKLRMVILDSCRVNPFANRMTLAFASRAPTRGLARPPEPDPGMLVVYAAKDGEVANDGAQASNSPFTAAFTKELAAPGIEVRRLFDRVRDDVIEATGGSQHPFTYGSLPGRADFFFATK